MKDRQVNIGTDEAFLLVDIANSLRLLTDRPPVKMVTDYVAEIPGDIEPKPEPEKVEVEAKKKEETKDGE